jgi:Rrf2 family transcriptional regulator, iron-sulfur cluster assembly transcription factor
MIRLSKKSLLALEAVVDIAYHARPEPVQSKEITERQGIPQRYLEQVMQQLVRAGILRGVRGPRGGYRLARERRRITAGEIVRVVGELEQKEEEALNGAGSELGVKVVRPLLAEIEEQLMQRLDQITIEELCRAAEQRGIEAAKSARLDFTI